MGIPFKHKIITPFTTNHTYLGRFGRGIVNISVIFLIWAFSGMVVDVGASLPKVAYYFISFATCFVLARLFTILMELIMRKTRYCMIRIVKYVIGIAVVIALHAPVLFFTVHQQDEFFHWGMISIIMLFGELCIWESLSMCFQLVLLLILQRSKNTQKGGNAIL
jgi:hypothetical protein